MRLRHVPVATWNTWGSVLSADREVNVTRDHQDVAVSQDGGGRVPAAGIHVGQVAPRVGEGVICAGPRQTHAIRDVAAGYEERAVSQERVAAAEDVVTRLC